MSSKLSASPRTAHTAITRMSSSRCSTFHSHLGSSTVSNAAIKVSSMASLRRKAEPLAGQAAEMEALISCVTPGFDKPARRPEDLHRPLAPHDDLDGALTWREERTVTGSLTLHYNKVLFLLEPTDLARGLARKRVTVHEFPDGRLAIRHKGRDLPYRTFDKLRRVDQAAVGGNKRLGGTVKLMLARIGKRRRSSALWPHAAASAPVTSAQIANACARTARYSAAGR